MLKFVKEHMETIDGIANYPMVSLLIFFVFFVLLFWWVFTATKEHIREMSELPLENEDQPNKLEYYEHKNTLVDKSPVPILPNLRIDGILYRLRGQTSNHRISHHTVFYAVGVDDPYCDRTDLGLH